MATINTPFNYNVGINYETWPMGRTNMDIATDLAGISAYFSLIKTYHDAAVGTSAIEIDPTQQQVISFITGGNTTQAMQLIMGTNNNALAQVNNSVWSAGLMTNSTYTDAWVTMIINAFGSVANTLQYLSCICLGNEVDANGPPVDDKHFTDYYTKWIPDAFSNLQTSLSAQGLASIPVTSIIANYPLQAPDTNIVSSSTTAYINTNWSASWNGGNPFVFFNQYTPDYGQSTDFNEVISYFNSVQGILNNAPQVFVGETGYSAEFNTKTNNQANVIGDMFTWLSSQQTGGAASTPLCVFQAFDHSQKAPGQQQMGLFDYSSGTFGVKSGISIPSWVNTPIT